MRALRRLATLWAILIGTAAVAIGLDNGTITHANWPFIGGVALVPLAICLAIEWAFFHP